MAARKDPRNRDSSNKLTQASQLLNRLISHANGEIELTQSQINAAKIVIGKYIPDLKAVEHSGEINGNVSSNLTIKLVKPGD
jgi:hypothetical protein